MNMLEIPLKYSQLSTNEIIREVEHSDNELAKALLCHMEAGTPAVEAMSTALAEARSNVETFLENLRVVLQEEQFDDCHIGEQLLEILELHEVSIPSDCSLDIDKFLKDERRNYEEAIADVWPEEMLTQKEGKALKEGLDSSIEDGSAWYDLPEFWDCTKTDFDNPFEEARKARIAREEAAKKAERERRAELRINQPLPAVRKSRRGKKS